MCPWGKCPGGTCPGGFCPVTKQWYGYILDEQSEAVFIAFPEYSRHYIILIVLTFESQLSVSCLLAFPSWTYFPKTICEKRQLEIPMQTFLLIKESSFACYLYILTVLICDTYPVTNKPRTNNPRTNNALGVCRSSESKRKCPKS